MALSAGLALAWVAACPAEADFVRYVVTSIDVDHEGVALTVYTVAARFDGPGDTVLLAYRLASDKPEHFAGFWHKDALSASSEDSPPALSKSSGTWSPALVVKPKVNRGVDSYLTIGGVAASANGTIADPSWSKTKSLAADGAPDTRGWSRPDLPTTGITGWYAVGVGAASAGRVGASPQDEVAGKPTLENPATDVRLAQFVLDRGHAPRSFELTVAFNDGTPDAQHRFATERFTLDTPDRAKAQERRDAK